MIKSKCKLCGKETEYKYPSLVREYCSYKCSNIDKWNTTRKPTGVTEFTCIVCGKVFTVKNYYVKAREKKNKIKYCSVECMGKGMQTKKKEIECKNCGSIFEDTRGEFCSHKCAIEYRKKTGGYTKTGFWLENGYKVLYTSDGNGIKEHIKVMQEHIGRELLPGEVVHHKDADKLNNDIDNLQLMTQSEHSKLHRELEKERGKSFFGK